MDSVRSCSCRKANAKGHSSGKKECKIEQREQLKRMTASEMLCCKMGVGHPWKFNLQEGGS